MKRIIYILIFTLTTTTVFGQSRKAMNLYKDKRFAEAIPYFEKTLEKDPSTKYQTKLAECYRKTNQLKKAESVYSKIVKRKHFSSKIMLKYGEVLMGLGKYDDAKSWFLKYSEKNPKDQTGQLKADACDYVKTIQPYFSKIEFLPIPFNTDADDSNPIVFKNKIYFSSDRKSGFNVLKKKSGWTGRDLMRIYSVDWQDTTFTDARPLPNRINNLNKNTGMPSFSRKGEFFFTRNTSSVSKDGTYKLHIFRSKLSPSGGWSKAEELSFCQLSINYLHPSVSDDGKTLFFASNRKGGEGGMDLFVSKKTGQHWGTPRNLGSAINTSDHEAFPFIHPSGKLFFSSKGHNGFGGFDIFVAEKNERGFWQQPINLGAPINSSGDDIGFFTDSLMQMALLSSTRASGNDDIFMCQIDTTSLLSQNLDSTKTLSQDSSFFAQADTFAISISANYQQAFQENNIQLMAGDTIYLVAPKYKTDEFDVPIFLRKQLDLLIPAMYLSPDFNYQIYCFASDSVDIFSEMTIVEKRAEAIGNYLAEKYIPMSQITAKGLILSNSQNLPIFADPKNIVILVKTNDEQ